METIKNFCEKNIFKNLVKKITKEDIGFFFNNSVAYEKEQQDNLSYYFTHVVYDKQMPNSSLYELFIPILHLLKVKALIRIKINLYTKTKKLHYHNPHVDNPFKHKGCVLSLNNCNGFTIIGNKKIPSIANQALLFDPSVSHNSTTCTDKPARININFNYF